MLRGKINYSLGKSILAALSIALILAGPAIAENDTIPQSGFYDWSGVYVGVQAGYGNVAITHDITNPSISHYWSDSTENWLAGGYIGINFQSDNNIVLGFEADWNLTNFSKTLTYAPDPTNQIAARIDDVASVRVRLGLAMDNILVYGTLGQAWMNGKHDQVLIPTNTINDHIRGWVIGGGFNYGITPSWSLKIEYLHYNFGEFYPQNAQGTTQVMHNYDVEMDQVSLGVAYKF